MMNGQTLEVLYSCAPCGLKKVPCRVPARGEHEDVAHWVRQTMALAISLDHAHRSPWCVAKSMSDVMIPVDGAPRVGDPVSN